MSSEGKTRERGIWLSIWLIIIMLYGIGVAVFIYVAANQPDAPSSFPWYITALVISVMAKLSGAIAIWNWRRWGLFLYTGGVVLAVIVGLVLTGLLSLVFVYIIPLAILGWLLKDKYSYFQ
jgi:hypothetical protein